MAQVKIYGRRAALQPRRSGVSDAIHRAVVEALRFPVGKRAHRFFYFDDEDFIFPPADRRTEDYTIIEISLFEGRAAETKKALIRLLFRYLAENAGLSSVNVEITLTEAPQHHWGLHGVPGDELALSYDVQI